MDSIHDCCLLGVMRLHNDQVVSRPLTAARYQALHSDVSLHIAPLSAPGSVPVCMNRATYWYIAVSTQAQVKLLLAGQQVVNTELIIFAFMCVCS